MGPLCIALVTTHVYCDPYKVTAQAGSCQLKERFTIPLMQGISQEQLVPRSRQQAKLDAHAQKLHQEVTGSNPAASSPLTAVLADLSYQPWQLQASPPQNPKVKKI